jgi:ribosomal protein L12E/L44/L45/RPP1/RPP2
MLKHYGVNILTKGIDLERNTMRDRVKKLISHLGGLEIEEIMREGRERVALVAENLGEPPCSP